LSGCAVGDALVVAVGPYAAHEIRWRWPPQDLRTIRAGWRYLLLLGCGRDDISADALRTIAAHFGICAEVVLVGSDCPTTLSSSDSCRTRLLGRLAQDSGYNVIGAQSSAALVDIVEVLEDFFFGDGPVGFDPAGLPFHNQPEPGQPLVTDLYREEVGRVPRLPDDVAEVSALLHLRRDRPLQDYNAIWSQYEARLPRRGTPFSMAVRFVEDGTDSEYAKLLVFRSPPRGS